MDESVLTVKEAIFWGALALGGLTMRFLAWFMPETAALWFDKMRKILTKDLAKEVHDLSQKVDVLIVENSNYKKEKHNLEGELLDCKDAIKTNDPEKLKLLKDLYDSK